jgi:uncharacterized protein
LAEDLLRREREGRGYVFYHYLLDLERGPCVYKRLSGCGSGSEYLAVTPGGELYPCHQFVGDPRYRLGDVWKGLTDLRLRDDFALRGAAAGPDCSGCWARLYCSGGCAANAYRAAGSINGVYKYGCELFKKRIECALMLKAAQAANDKEGLRPGLGSGGAEARTAGGI